jgi:lysophospholipase L1-like esterase
MLNDSSKQLLKVGLGLLLLFLLFFSLGNLHYPLSFDLKKVDLSNLQITKKPLKQKQNPKGNIEDKKLDSLDKVEHQKLLKVENGITPVDTPEGVERVLLLGDSQLEGLRSPVSAYCNKNGHVLLSTVIYYGSSTKQWGSSDTLDYFLREYKPSVVFFAIGLNELFVNDLEQRGKYMKKIIETFEKYNVRYLWIGPAAWTSDKGIVAKMKEVVGDRFFASEDLELERAADGRHPSKSGAKIWFDKVAATSTEKGILDLSKTVDTLPKLKFTRTILMNIKYN